MTDLLAGTGLLLLWLAVHPFITYPSSMALLARLRPRKIEPRAGWLPRGIAVCVCAYNEAATIGARVENLLAARQALPELEILIYVDGATDATTTVLSGFGDRIRVIASAARHGKSFGMNTLVAATDAELVVFSDANVTFAPDAIAHLIQVFADPAVGCACGNLEYSGVAGRGGAAATGSLYWRREERIKALESATGSVMGADGSIFAIRRALHVPPPADLIDDMYVSFRVLLQGFRIVRVAEARATEPPVARADEEFRRKIRIACQAMNVHRALWPEMKRLPALDLYKYVSHKLLRWFSAYLAALGALSLAISVLASGGRLWFIILLLTCSCGIVLTLRARSGRLAGLRNIGLALVATAAGVAQSYRGARFQTWTPPATARLSAQSGTLE